MMKKIIIISISAVLIVALAVGIYFISTAAEKGTLAERIAKADELVENGELKKAENTYKSIIKEDPSDIETSKKLGEMYLEKGNYEKAEELSDKMIANNREDFSLYEDRLRIYRKNGDVAGAISFIGSVNDDEIRRMCIDALYDREGEASLIMGNTPGNYSNGSLIAFSGDTIIYSNLSDNKKLYKLEGGINTMLYDGKAESISVIGDDIYFISESEGWGIFKIKTDGTGFGPVKNVPARDLMVVGGKMYFVNLSDMKVYEMDVDGKGLKKLSDNKTMYLYYYGAKFYTENEKDIESTLRMSLDGSDEQVYLSNSSYFITGYDNMLYFRDNTDVGVWATDMSGTFYDRVHESRSGYINAKDKYVYFVDFEDSGSIIKMNLECTEKTKLSSDDAINLTLDKNYIYYFSEALGNKLCRINNDGTNKVVLN